MQILTAQQAKGARDELNLSQRRVALDADVSRPMLSLFEQQRALPEDAFLTTLRNFFEAQGVEFEDLDDDEPAAPAGVSIVNGVVVSPASRRGFRLMDGIAVPAAMPVEDADALLEQLADVEDEIDELKARPVALGRSMFSGPSEKKIAEQQRLRLLMARSHCLMRALQGRESIEPCTEAEADLEEGGVRGDQGSWLSQVFGDLFGNASPDDEVDALTEDARRTNLIGMTRLRSRPREAAVFNGDDS